MAIIKCPECGHQVSDQAKTCPSCGIDIAGKVVRCSHCGEYVFKNQEFCPGCHQPLRQAGGTAAPVGSTPSPSSSSQVATSSSTQKASASSSSQAAVASSSETAATAASKSSRRKYTALTVAFVFSLAIVLVGVFFYMSTESDNEMEAYQNARNSSEPAVLESYLAQYAEAPVEHRDSIQLLLSQLQKVETEWTDAVMAGTKMALERYVRLYPNSIHITEAKIKIDSIDWEQAKSSQSPEAVQTYLNRYPDGLHVDEANDLLEKLKTLGISPDDKQLVEQVFGQFFAALGSRDEMALTATVANVMSSFLHKPNATKTDVLSYLKKLYAPDDIESMEFHPVNDWKIEKQVAADGSSTYTVNFSVDQKIHRSNADLENFCTYKVTAILSADSKISELNMQKLRQ